MSYLQENLEDFKKIFNCLKNIYSKEYSEISIKNMVFDSFLQKKSMTTSFDYEESIEEETEKETETIEEILVSMDDFCNDYIYKEKEILRTREKKEKVKESLKLEEELGFKYFIDNQLTYYYLDEDNCFCEIDFKNIFQKSLQKRYVADCDYKEIQKFLGEPAVKYFYYCFKKLLKDSI